MKTARATLFSEKDISTKDHDTIMMRFIEADEKYGCLLNKLFWMQKPYRTCNGGSSNDVAIIEDIYASPD